MPLLVSMIQDKLWCPAPSIWINFDIGDSSLQCLHHSIQGRRGSHVTITHDALPSLYKTHNFGNPPPKHDTLLDIDPLPQSQPPGHETPLDKNPLPYPLIVISGGHQNICSNLYTSGASVSADIWWLLKHVCLAQPAGMHPTGMLSCC